MGIAPTIKYFGRFPSVIVMQSSSQFDGTSIQSSLPVVSPGVYTFPAQAGGGVFNLHESPIEVKQIAYAGGGTLTVTKVVGTPASPLMSSVVEIITGTTPVNFTNLYLAPGEFLTLVSTGGTSPKISITSHEASYAADGAG